MRRPTLIILGNGYDIAWGLKSSYNDFLHSRQFHDLSSKYPHDSDDNLFSFINNENVRRGWCDLEEDLFNYSRILTINHGNPDTFKEEYEKLKLALQDFLIGLQHNANNNENKTLWNIQKQWAEENEIIGIISLNYTAFSKLRFNQITNNPRVSYPHGFIIPQVACINPLVVFGIDESMEVSSDHAFIYKYRDKNINREIIVELASSAEKLIFYGCSFGKSDTWLYHTLFHHGIKKIEIYDVNICNIIKGIISQCPEKLYNYISYISLR